MFLPHTGSLEYWTHRVELSDKKVYPLMTHSDIAEFGVSLQSWGCRATHESLVANDVEFLYVNRIDQVSIEKMLFGNSRRI